ncbi:MAG TPA: hypothetical protein PKG68_07540 [Bacteroidales bacterium]|nr:hypothetical protein [Bacteroidales bacterium]
MVPVPAFNPQDKAPAAFIDESAGEAADDSVRTVGQPFQAAPGPHFAFLTGIRYQLAGL